MDEYLKTLLEQIRCKKARPYIRQELQDHIEDQIEANIHAGMNYEDAEKEAVRDMGDPVETGISLDRIHKPQIAWKLLVMVILLSVAGILTHIMIARHINEGDASVSGRYVIHVMVGIVHEEAVILLVKTGIVFHFGSWNLRPEIEIHKIHALVGLGNIADLLWIDGSEIIAEVLRDAACGDEKEKLIPESEPGDEFYADHA